MTVLRFETRDQRDTTRFRIEQAKRLRDLADAVESGRVPCVVTVYQFDSGELHTEFHGSGPDVAVLVAFAQHRLPQIIFHVRPGDGSTLQPTSKEPND